MVEPGAGYGWPDVLNGKENSKKSTVADAGRLPNSLPLTPPLGMHGRILIATPSLVLTECLVRMRWNSPRARRRDDDDRCHDRGPPECGPDSSHPRPIREACPCEQTDGEGDGTEDERPCGEPCHLG